MIASIAPLWTSVQGGFRLKQIAFRSTGKGKEVNTYADSREGPDNR
jgi:hypothetical protein